MVTGYGTSEEQVYEEPLLTDLDEPPPASVIVAEPAPMASITLECSQPAYTEYPELGQPTCAGGLASRGRCVCVCVWTGLLFSVHRLIQLTRSPKCTNVWRCVPTGSEPQQEDPQEGLREHLKKTLEFCLSRLVLFLFECRVDKRLLITTYHVIILVALVDSNLGELDENDLLGLFFTLTLPQVLDVCTAEGGWLRPLCSCDELCL